MDQNGCYLTSGGGGARRWAGRSLETGTGAVGADVCKGKRYAGGAGLWVTTAGHLTDTGESPPYSEKIAFRLIDQGGAAGRGSQQRTQPARGAQPGDLSQAIWCRSLTSLVKPAPLLPVPRAGFLLCDTLPTLLCSYEGCGFLKPEQHPSPRSQSHTETTCVSPGSSEASLSSSRPGSSSHSLAASPLPQRSHITRSPPPRKACRNLRHLFPDTCPFCPTTNFCPPALAHTRLCPKARAARSELSFAQGAYCSEPRILYPRLGSQHSASLDGLCWP